MLQAAVPEALVEIRPPRVPQDQGNGVVLFLYHDGSRDEMKTSGAGSLRRHHAIQMRLMILTTADDTEAELRLLDLHDRITNLFSVRGTGRTIGGAVPTSTLYQRDGDHGRDARYSKPFEGADAPEWLSRWWTLDAEEPLVFDVTA